MIEAVLKNKKWLIPALLVLLLAIHTVQAQVAFRAVASASQTFTVSGGTISVTKPAGTARGDVLLASIAVVPNTLTGVIAPAGWTLKLSSHQTSDSTSMLYTYYRVASGSEPTSYDWTFPGANSGVVATIAGFSGADSASPIDASAAQNTPRGNSHTAQSLSATVAGDMLVTVHEYASSRNWTPPPGMTVAADRYSNAKGGNTGVSMELNYEKRHAVGATGTRTATVQSNKDSGAAHAILLKATAVVVAPTLGEFNSYDSSTPANAIDGLIKTKVAGPFTLDIVALNSGKTAILTSFIDAVKVELLNAVDNSAVPDGNGCRSGWTTIQTVSATFVRTNNGRMTVSFTENNVYRDVRVRVTYQASGKPTKIGCSSDNFALRPASFAGLTVGDADWQSAGTARALSNVGASGGVVHKAGHPFRIGAVAQNGAGTGIAYGTVAGNYNGQPQALISCEISDLCTPDTLSTLDELGAANAWTASAGGSFYSATASYNEAGSFTMQLVDTDFAAVDKGDGTPADCNGQHICSSSPPLKVGRFVPDHFELADASVVDPLVDPAVDIPLPAPQFQTFGLPDAKCNAAAPRRAFTYIGQAFGYVSVPQFTFKAMDAGGNPMSNYQPTLTKLAVTQTYTAASGNLDPALLLLLGTPTPTLNANYTNGNYSPVVGTFAVNNTDKLAFKREALEGPFKAEIKLSITLQDSSENAAVPGNGTGIITAAAPVVFNAIDFDAGKEMRFGRLKLSSAHGSELLNLPIPLEAQFWSGTAFVTNTADSCTVIPMSSITMGNYRKQLNACETQLSHVGNVTMVAGKLPSTGLWLTKPGANNTGSVDLAINLSATAAGNTCVSGAESAATAANMPWFGSNPRSRATFGVYKNSNRNANGFVYIREMY